MSRLFVGACAAAMAMCVGAFALAQPVSRPGAAAGAVIARKSGEEVQFIDVSAWQPVELAQDLLPGDVLRTNATGQLAVLFADQTQMRLARNTSLVVKGLGGGDSAFGLQSGTIWGRAQRGGLGLTVDTPAASAAIRGTDWSLAVGADGRTTLIVLEGLVELSNEFGSVSVAEGEAATAAIGQAPTKIVIVDPDDREQMLFYLSLPGAFTFLPASPLASPEMRQARTRIGAIPPERRSTEDWLTLAEVSLSYDGRQAARAALARLDRQALTPAQQARYNLIDALNAGAEKRYEEAARLFAAAAAGLDPGRRTIARFGGYYARALADPDRVESPPASGEGPYGAIAEALTAGFLDDIPAAIEVLKRAERTYPHNPTLPAMRAQLAILIDDRAQVEEAVARALALDPDDPTALEARAGFKAGTQSDLESALADLQRAVTIAPGATSAWNALGLVQSARGDNRRAEAALLRSIALDPQDPVSWANLGILYLDQGRIAEAKTAVDAAIAADPSFSIGLIARGRYHLQTGELDKAVTDFLAGTTDNPAYSQGLLLLAAAHFENGDLDAGMQALENADRLDPNDPVNSALATRIAIDDYRAGDAIRGAQEFLARGRARGGDFASLQANQSAGSTLNNAFRLQGLNAWGQYYGEAVFQPFSSSGYIDQAVGGSVNPYANALTPGTSAIEPTGNAGSFSAFFQGLLLDPLPLASRSRGVEVLRRPFLEGAIALGGVAGDGESGWTGDAELQGTSNTPIPMSFYGTLSRSSFPGSRPEFGIDDAFRYDIEQVGGTAYLTATPTPYDRVVIYGTASDGHTSFLSLPDPGNPLAPFATFESQDVELRQISSGIAWSHDIDYRNVVTSGLLFSDLNGESKSILSADTIGPGLPPLVRRTVTGDLEERSLLAAFGHAVERGASTFRYGIEAGVTSEFSRSETADELLGIPLSTAEVVEKSDTDIGRAYFDMIYDVSDAFFIEGALFGSYINGGDIDEKRLEPRLGLAFTPATGHWLRAGFLREGLQNGIPTLSPIGVAGLQSIQKPLTFEGYADTLIARWDAEWTPRFFTSLDYQHQELNGLSVGVPATVVPIALSEGRIDRASVTANILIADGLGAFASFAYAGSENEDSISPGFGDPLPYVPETAAQIGFTYVHPSNVRLTLATSHIGKRTGEPGAGVLDEYWTADVSLSWEPFDERFELDLQAYNLFDEEFEVSNDTPGYGRTFVGKLKVRF